MHTPLMLTAVFPGNLTKTIILDRLCLQVL